MIKVISLNECVRKRKVRNLERESINKELKEYKSRSSGIFKGEITYE